MRYKQVNRILSEIVSDRQVPPTIVLAIAKLAMHGSVPKLGPYKKRSVFQALWRVASDSARSANQRWAALQKLLNAPLTSED